jgi:hypothetical protein
MSCVPVVRETNLKVIHSVACSSRIGLLVAFISITHQPCRWRVGVLLHLATAGYSPAPSTPGLFIQYSTRPSSVSCWLLTTWCQVCWQRACRVSCLHSLFLVHHHNQLEPHIKAFHSTPLEQQATTSISPVAIDNNWPRYHKRVAQLDYVRLISVRRCLMRSLPLYDTFIYL